MTSIPPTADALREALSLSDEILADVELSRIPLTNVALKCSRVARLLNDLDHQTIFRYEASGYPSEAGGVPREVWRLAELAGRQYSQKTKDGESTYAYCESIEQLEGELSLAKRRLEVARDPDVAISSSNASQYVHTPPGNKSERDAIQNKASASSRRLAQRRSYIHQYISRVHYELRFSQVASDVFSRLRQQSDRMIGEIVPDAVQKFAAVYENLVSENPEDWCNAVHSCRRILQALADALFPPSDLPRTSGEGRSQRDIRLGTDNYINRLVCFAEDLTASQTAINVIGSQLMFLGDRLDALFAAAQKGSHGSVTRRDADRFVVYTYLLTGDLLSLREQKEAR